MKYIRTMTALAGAIGAGLAAGAAQAQDLPPVEEFYAGPPEIVLYDFPAFAGQSLTLNADAENLTRQNFNDRTSSIRVLSGNWEVCYDANYRSQCIVLTADQPTLGRMDNQISSVRIERSATPPGGGDRDGSITFFAGPNYTGQSVTLDSAVNNFESLRFMTGPGPFAIVGAAAGASVRMPISAAIAATLPVMSAISP